MLFSRSQSCRSWAACLSVSLACLLPAAFHGQDVQAAGAVYYVAPTGSDADNGSQLQPFREIRRALQVVTAGDTILVADGDYKGFDVRLNGTATAPITIRATGTNARVLPTTDRGDNRDTIFITFSSFVVVDGLRSFNANRAALRVDQSPRITVRNCVFGQNATWGIFTDFSNDLLIENNECYGSGAEHGIYVSNSGDRPVLRRNRCYNNRGCGIQLNADLSAGGDGLITGAVIENNVLYGNGAGGGAAINLDGVQDSIVRNNLIYNNLATGIVNYQGDGAAGPTGMQILHNTVDQPSNGRWAMLIGNTTGRNYVRNNILHHRGTWRGGILFGSLADAGNTDSGYNILDRVSPDNGTTSISLAQWQAQGHEPSSFSAPLAGLFVNPDAANYHLPSTSPAVDRGQTQPSVTTDLDGKPRPMGVSSDIGCYESDGSQPPPAPAPVLSSLTLSPTAVRGGRSSTGTVRLSAPAPPGGVVISLSSSSTLAATPPNVTVAGGASTAAFSITTRRVNRQTAVTISATYAGVTKTAVLTLKR
jgi:parallel beta-helix repeat protein